MHGGGAAQAEGGQVEHVVTWGRADEPDVLRVETGTLAWRRHGPGVAVGGGWGGVAWCGARQGVDGWENDQ